MIVIVTYDIPHALQCVIVRLLRPDQSNMPAEVNFTSVRALSLVSGVVFSILHCYCITQTFNVRMQQISVHEGLSDALVNAVAKTDDHSLWIGTNDGLNYFDGFRLREYNTLNSTLPGNLIRDLFVLPDGRLIVVVKQSAVYAYLRGLYFYDEATDDFIGIENTYEELPFLDCSPSNNSKISSPNVSLIAYK